MRNDYPTWQERQKWLYEREQKTPKESLKKCGDEAFQREYYQEALEYYAGAGDAEGLRRIEQIAMEEGDAFLMQSLEHLTHEVRPDGIWNQLGQQGLALGKTCFARKAFERTNNQKQLEEVLSHDPQS